MLGQFSGKCTICEIGSFNGASTVVMANTIKRKKRKNCKIYAIDPHEGNLGDLYKSKHSSTFDVFQKNIKDYEVADYIVPIVEKSCDVQWSQRIHLLFIDGLHDYDNVRHDFEKFDPFVVENGFVCMHDYNNNIYPDVTEYVNNTVLPLLKYLVVAIDDTMVVLKKTANFFTNRRLVGLETN